jgi:hypothetical protein
MITRDLDTQSGVILVRSIGAATEEEIVDHYCRMHALVAELREAGRPVRVLSDQRQAVRLPHHLNLLIKDQIEQTYQAGDRVALLMNTVEDQQYARGVLGTTHYAVFTSLVAAEIWLTEPDLRPPAA